MAAGFKGHVRSAGGGVVEIVVDRATDSYPGVGQSVKVEYPAITSATPADIAEWQMYVAAGRTYLGLFEFIAQRDAGELVLNGDEEDPDRDYDDRML